MGGLRRSPHLVATQDTLLSISPLNKLFLVKLDLAFFFCFTASLTFLGHFAYTFLSWIPCLNLVDSTSKNRSEVSPLFSTAPVTILIQYTSSYWDNRGVSYRSPFFSFYSWFPSAVLHKTTKAIFFKKANMNMLPLSLAPYTALNSLTTSHCTHHKVHKR